MRARFLFLALVLVAGCDDCMKNKNWGKDEKEKATPSSAPFRCEVDRSADCIDACKRGLATACVDLGISYEKGTGVAQDDDKAAEAYLQACEGDSAAGCTKFSYLYAESKGKPKDGAKREAFLKRACAKKLKEPCADLGDMYLEGDGVAFDQRLGTQFLKESCALGYAYACGRLQ